MININFLATKQSKKERQRKGDHQLFRISSYIFAGVLLISAILLGIRTWSNFRIKKLDNDIKNYKNTILSQENVELSYLIFVNKLQVISDIYQMRSNKQDAMNYFTDAFRDVAEVTGMNYQEDEGGLSLQLTNPSIFQLEKSYTLLDAPELTSYYKSIQKEILARNDDGSYQLTVKLELQPQAEITP